MIKIYGTPDCSFCKQAVLLCESKAKQYRYTDLTEDIDAMVELSEKIGNFRSVPQIFIDDEHLGGFAELQVRLNEN